MADEYVTRTPQTDPASQPTHTTVIHERGSSSGGGIAIALVLLVAVLGGFYLFSQSTSSETAKNNAIARAADSVGSAAGEVGDAAKDAADNVGSN